MKQSIFNLLMAAFAIVACAKQPVVEEISVPEEEPVVETPANQEPEPYVYTISASSADPDVKTDYDADGVFSWSAGDAISVLFHNDSAPDEEKNKFFTLTTAQSGASVTFSGTIDGGYTIGASDGDASDMKIWALFPASNKHSYTIGANPNFYIPSVTDFTLPGSHVSANLPLYALNAEEGSLAFKHLASAYKLNITNIDNVVTKVKVTFTNQVTYALSGTVPIHNDFYLNHGWSAEGSAERSYSVICNVTSNQAVAYIPCRYYGDYQPTITIYNNDTGIPIKTFTASSPKQLTHKGDIQPLTLNLTGGDYFVPAISINGNMADWDPSSNTKLTLGTNYLAYIASDSSAHYKEFKVAYDSRYIYLYSKRDYNSELWTSDGYYYFTFDRDNDDTYELDFYLRPFVKGNLGAFNPAPTSNITTNPGISSFSTSCGGTSDASIIETEISILRSDLGITNGNIIKIKSRGNKSASEVTLPSSLTITD